MSTPQPRIAPKAPQVTTTSSAGHTTSAPNSPPAHTTNTSIQPAAATTAFTPNAPITTPQSTAPTQVKPTQPASADLESLTYNGQLNAVDRLWKFKMALTIILILTGIIGIGCIAWAFSTSLEDWKTGYDSGYDTKAALPWGLIPLCISVVWCFLCIILFVSRKCPVHPGARVTMELLLWLGFLVTALWATSVLVDLLPWGEDGTLGDESGWSDSRYGEYQLQKNNTWVWVQDSDYSVSYQRICNGSNEDTDSYGYYGVEKPFTSCAEIDAWVNALWQAKPNRARTISTGVVCQWIGLVLHFALFVWACVDCHKYRRSKVSKDAEKIAAGIVEKMVRNGAIIPPPQQAHMPTAGWQPTHHQLPNQSTSIAGQGQGQGQVYPAPWQQHNSGEGGPIPPLPPRHPEHQHVQARLNNEKTGGVATSYYEPGR